MNLIRIHKKFLIFSNQVILLKISNLTSSIVCLDFWIAVRQTSICFLVRRFMGIIRMKYLVSMSLLLKMTSKSGKFVAPRDLYWYPSVNIGVGCSGGRSNFLAMIGWMFAQSLRSHRRFPLGMCLPFQTLSSSLDTFLICFGTPLLSGRLLLDSYMGSQLGCGRSPDSFLWEYTRWSQLSWISRVWSSWLRMVYR